MIQFSSDFFGIPLLDPFVNGGSGGGDGDSVSGSDDGAANAFDHASYGLWSTIMENPAINSAIEQIPDEATSLAAAITTAQQSETPNLHPERRERLEEFSSAFLAMSVFDVADFWLPSARTDGTPNLHHVFSLTSDDNNTSLDYFKIASNNTTISAWAGAVGRAFCSGSAVWSTNPETIVDVGRREAFAIANIRTSLAVPIFSSGSVSPCCVLCFYSMVRSDCVPFVLKFVQQALRSLWYGLESIEPHESIGRDLWKDVAPADLGEMAADLEMQKAFYQKKRPFEAISSIHVSGLDRRPFSSKYTQYASHFSLISCKTQENTGSKFYQDTTEDTDSSSALAAQLQSLPTPSGDVNNLTNGNRNISAQRQYQNAGQTAQTIQNHLQDALRLAADARPITDYNEGNVAKRMNIGSGTPGASPALCQLAQPYNPSQSQDFPASNLSASTMSIAPEEMKMEAVQTFALNASRQIQPLPLPLPLPQQQPPSQSQKILFVPQTVISQNSNHENSPFLPPTDASTLAPRENSKPGRPVCRIQGCSQLSATRKPYCTKHSGNRICEHDGCAKCAQGATRFCIGHGGGRRCTFLNCDKGARDKFFCAAHGGGKRCSNSGCQKSAVGGSSLCTSHGGGRRCAVENCEKSAQSSTKFCVKHGGGKKCCHVDCEKVARGRTQYCASHGGGVRCKLGGCSRIAIGKMQLCRAHGGGSKKRSPTNIEG